MTVHQLGFGFLVALRLNGTVLHETILGSGDTGEDDFRQSNFFSYIECQGLREDHGVFGKTARTMTIPGAHKFPDREVRSVVALPQGGGGISGARLPMVVDAMVELIPGENTLEVVIMNIQGSMTTPPNVVPNAAGALEQRNCPYVGQRELFILEMVR